MKVVDTNVLLYALDESAVQHVPAHRWLSRALRGRETVGFAWIVLVAFMRLSTHPTIQANPLTCDQALDVIDGWLARPNAVVVAPGRLHLRSMRTLLSPAGAAGNLANDAHLAALAEEHKATVVTYDNDFARFSGVTWRTPDQLFDV